MLVLTWFESSINLNRDQIEHRVISSSIELLTLLLTSTPLLDISNNILMHFSLFKVFKTLSRVSSWYIPSKKLWESTPFLNLSIFVKINSIPDFHGLLHSFILVKLRRTGSCIGPAAHTITLLNNSKL